MVLYIIVITLIAVNILEIVWIRLHHSNQTVRTSRIAASIIGLIAGLIGAEHGYYEILQRGKTLNGILFDAISGTSYSIPPTSQWTGWPALAFIPNLLVTGILIILSSLALMLWAAAVVQRRSGGLVLILLSILVLLVGGGFIPPFFGIIAGTIGARAKPG